MPIIGLPAGRENWDIEGDIIHGPGFSRGRAACVTGPLIGAYADAGTCDGTPVVPAFATE